MTRVAIIKRALLCHDRSTKIKHAINQNAYSLPTRRKSLNRIQISPWSCNIASLFRLSGVVVPFKSGLRPQN